VVEAIQRFRNPGTARARASGRGLPGSKTIRHDRTYILRNLTFEKKNRDAQTNFRNFLAGGTFFDSWQIHEALALRWYGEATDGPGGSTEVSL